MYKKGFEADVSLNETPNFKDPVDKPFKSENNNSRKVDINVLKARAQEIQIWRINVCRCRSQLNTKEMEYIILPHIIRENLIKGD